MKLFSLKRALSPLLFAAAVASLLNCGGGREESFSTQGDASVMAGIVGTWMATSKEGNTYTLTLCEDTSDRETDLSCQTLHKVQGDGRGVSETTEEPTGCGGCDYDYSAYVVGSMAGDDLAATDVHGQFALTRGDADGKLGFPYTVRFEATSAPYDGAKEVFLQGGMEGPGSFDVDSMTYPASIETSDADASDAAPVQEGDGSVSSGASRGSAADFTFHRIGDATCPAK